MDLRRATQIYKQTTISTTSATEGVIIILKEIQKKLHQCLLAFQQQQLDMYHEPLADAQHLLFELMATIDRHTDEGQRLFLFYVYLNQCLVEVQLVKKEARLQEVQAHIETLIEAWEYSKLRNRLQTYTSNQI